VSLALAALVVAATVCAGPRGVVVQQDEPAGLEQAWAPRRVALVVGLDQYEDPALGSLRFASKDARDLAELLSSPEHGDFDEVVVVAGRAERPAILGALEDLSAGLHRDDTLLVYFAGHGTLDLAAGRTTLYLLPTEARLHRAAVEGIAVGDLERVLEASPARRRVLVVDACYAGQGRSGLAPEVQSQLERVRGPVPAPRVREISRYDARLFAAHHDQPAMEDPELENGVYTHFLLEALRGDGDLDGDGLVDVLEAHAWARDATMDFTHGAQVPWLQATLVGRDAIFLTGDELHRGQAERAVLVGLDRLPQGTTLSVDGQARGEGALAPGHHRLEITRFGEPLLLDRVVVEAGERVDLSALVTERGQRLELDVGLAWLPDGAVMPHWAPTLEAWWWPADASGARWGYGLSADTGLGVVDGNAAWSFPDGELLARVVVARGEALFVGPVAGLGAFWRVPQLHAPQVGPMASIGGRLGVPLGPARMAAYAELHLVSLDARPVVYPSLGLSLGVRLR
jgi:uncharacterized caspase-like protein